jgi:hypothetical protein
MKELKDLYIENCETWMKVIEEDTNKWKSGKISSVHGLNIVKVPILLITEFPY